ncbi:nitrogen fixation-related uncharacterized protein [Sulfitobacter undariae]|jgi:hypothetical protein|uniref:Nitrogen fixation-related uncharacterized protein n=1 Tax=Sulfitobacter undariae TaxID=1563671 RepID=A0A7W6EDF6_9RHOB|nr:MULTISPECIES: hypothetical protein [Rhodobacterales]MBB3995774.1 nitrogen fixation-related uncharacterized protein [Sulfitobacter undariae]
MTIAQGILVVVGLLSGLVLIGALLWSIARPSKRILCKKTDTLVGYLYQWNNGDLQPAWLNDAMPDVRYEPMVEAA